jgi:uncharacterized YccA/Bax inhibitor family protein
MIKSSNPALNERIFLQSKELSPYSQETMTIQGTVTKTFILIVLVLAAAVYSWGETMTLITIEQASPTGYILGGALVGFVFALITVFKKNIAMYTAPLYAVAEGVFLGAVSATYELKFPGIVTQALMGTFGVFFVMLFIYKTKIIKPTENFKLGVAAATGAIALLYIVSMVAGFFGVNFAFMNDSSPLSIGISIFIVGIAALNLVMDFDFIEQGEQVKAPKYMEWYSAFGLLVTLVWLYIEILRLLSKINKR